MASDADALSFVGYSNQKALISILDDFIKSIRDYKHDPTEEDMAKIRERMAKGEDVGGDSTRQIEAVFRGFQAHAAMNLYYMALPVFGLELANQMYPLLDDGTGRRRVSENCDDICQKAFGEKMGRGKAVADFFQPMNKAKTTPTYAEVLMRGL